MLTVFGSPRPPRREAALASEHSAVGAHCTERPEVNQDKPDSEISLARAPRGPPHRSFARPMLLGGADLLAGASGISPLYDVKKAAADSRSGKVALMHGCEVCDANAGGASRDRTGDLKLAKLALSQLSYGPAGIRNGGPGKS